MYLTKLKTQQEVYSNPLLGKAILCGFMNVEELRAWEDTLKKDKETQEPIYPKEFKGIEVFELSHGAIQQYQEQVEQKGRMVRDLVFNTETGLFDEATEDDIKKVGDRKTEENVRAQCAQLLSQSDCKLVPDNDADDIKKWTAWRQSIRAIMKDPLKYVGKTIPATPFPVSWDPKGRLIVRVEVS